MYIAIFMTYRSHVNDYFLARLLYLIVFNLCFNLEDNSYHLL